MELMGKIDPPRLNELSVKAENMKHACTLCRKGGVNLLFCSKCKHATYCNRDCQVMIGYDIKRNAEHAVMHGMLRKIL